MEKKTETEKPSSALPGAWVFLRREFVKSRFQKTLFMMEIDVCIYIIIYAAYAN